MRDPKKTSASDELVRRAREGTSGELPDFEPEPIAAPDYSDVPEWSPPSTDDSSSGMDISAEDIAAELLDAGAIAPRSDEPADTHDQLEREAAAPSSLPSWATTDASPSPEPPIDRGSEHPRRGRSSETSPPPDHGFDRVTTPADDVYSGQWESSTPEWEAYQAERAARKQKGFDFRIPTLKTLVWMGVFAFVGISALVGALDDREAIGELAVGDCFMSGDAIEVFSVPVVDCDEEHDSELFARIDTSEVGGVYPGEDPLFEWLYGECIAEFPAYVGESYERSPYYIETFIPTQEGWAEGDRVGLCTLVVVNDELETIVVTGSRRGIADEPASSET